ncbi:MAG: hypothetical protein KAR35_10815 [Candidatus Heimdallarchaeota archaeon]|nr:hypothetical protein [Candidatus Heimdallarchaeota archaeon]MCK5049850.1 hypothetical protein [Candidatus Heimdallarchaeota archaeon]
MASVTLAKMATIEPDTPITLPETFLEALATDEKTHCILILAPNTKIIRLIPTASNKVIKVNINIGKLSPDFLRQMGSIFIRLGIKTLYSTGLCFTQETCVYEGYIDSVELEDISVDTIKNEFIEIEGVTTVDIDELII